MATTKKGIVFRVSNLPALGSDIELRETLKAFVKDKLVDDERSKLSFEVDLVPCCDGNNAKVALIEFKGGVPAFLASLTADTMRDWQLPMGDTDINFDRHFLGFTQLYTPTPSLPITADIIAITGLDGHAYGSWRGKGNLGRMWLRDFLSKDLPCCRTMTYGYNSKLETEGVDTIMDYGRGLIEGLKKVRDTEELRKRPIFFIAHSFGGIILAHCLVKAIQTNEEDHPTIASLHKSTYGMLLFGIPHKGMLIDDILNMVAGQNNHPRKPLLEQIRNKSDQLECQVADFRNLIRDRKIVSFYERVRTRKLQHDAETNRWRRTGDFFTAVGSDSALLHLPDSIEVKIPVEADHSTIVKFDTQSNQCYTSVRDKLRQFEKDAPKVVAARFSQAQSRPKPSMELPFLRDEKFVGREDILTKMSEKFEKAASQSHSRVALFGLGGIGKSQIAIEYAYRVRESAPQTWVFWIHASTAIRFRQAFMNIASLLELPERDDPKVDILHLVRHWLCDERNGRWLLILDNADDYSVFSSTNEEADSLVHGVDAAVPPLDTFIPQSSNGWILVTSRDRLAAQNLIFETANVINVGSMPEKDSLLLLKNKLPVAEEFEDDARTLVRALRYIPLAITHAGAYLKMRDQTMNISRYLLLFRENEENQAKLLSDNDIKDNDIKDNRRDFSVSHAVITTWQISFDQILRTTPGAADLLSLMAMFDRQAIPESIVSDGRPELDFENALWSLTRFSLINALVTTKKDHQFQERLFEIHDLVQLATRKWLERKGQITRWRKASLRIMASAYPTGEHETWADCRALLPHAQKVLAYDLEERESSLDRARIARNTSWYLLLVGEYAAAEKICRTLVVLREKTLGPGHHDTLASVSTLGSALMSQGKYKEAELMHRRAMKGLENVLGREQSDGIPGVASNLRSLLTTQGNYEEAETMHRRTLEVMEKVLGAEPPDTLARVIKLGSLLARIGKHKEAETMYQQALEMVEVLGVEDPEKAARINNFGSLLASHGKYEEEESMHQQELEIMEVLGLEHPNTLFIVNNLGSLLEGQGKYGEAEAMYRRVLEGVEKLFGQEHPHMLASVNQLATVLGRQGKHEEAEAMLRRALEGEEILLGRDHPETLDRVANLGVVLGRQGKHEEAEVMLRRVLSVVEKKLGEEHPKTLSSINNLGLVLTSQGKYEEAEAVHRRALGLKEKVLGQEHPKTLSSINNLGSVLTSQGKYEEAEAMLRRALKVMEKVLGEEHPDTAGMIGNLGLLLMNQGKYKEGETMLRRALRLMDKMLGEEHPNTVGIAGNLGLLLMSQGKYEEAEAIHRRALVIKEKVCGVDHLGTLASINNLGSSLSRQGKYEEAETMYRRALQIMEVLGVDDLDTLASINNLGSVMISQGKHVEAETIYRRALQIMEAHRVEDPNTLASVNNLESLLESQGKYKEAEAMYRRALEVMKKVLVAGHPNTLASANNLGSLLAIQGKYEEAETMYRRALGTMEALGVGDPNTIVGTFSDLGSVLASQGKYKEAEKMYRGALGTMEALGVGDLNTLVRIFNDLGSSLERQGKDAEAETMYRRAQDIMAVLGVEQSVTLNSVKKLESVLASQEGTKKRKRPIDKI